MSNEEVAQRAGALLEGLGVVGAGCDLVEGRSMVGGGSLPEESLPTTLIALPSLTASGLAPEAQAQALRTGRPSIVPRIQENRVVLDLRTVLPRQEALLARRLADLL